MRFNGEKMKYRYIICGARIYDEEHRKELEKRIGEHVIRRPKASPNDEVLHNGKIMPLASIIGDSIAVKMDKSLERKVLTGVWMYAPYMDTDKLQVFRQSSYDKHRFEELCLNAYTDSEERAKRHTVGASAQLGWSH